MVYPNRMLGQQLLDAGIVQFAPGSQLDIQKSMGSLEHSMDRTPSGRVRSVVGGGREADP